MSDRRGHARPNTKLDDWQAERDVGARGDRRRGAEQKKAQGAAGGATPERMPAAAVAQGSTRPDMRLRRRELG